MHKNRPSLLYFTEPKKKKSVINAAVSNSYNFYGKVTENLQKCRNRLERRAYKIVETQSDPNDTISTTHNGSYARLQESLNLSNLWPAVYTYYYAESSSTLHLP
jgi:hypothetical protein